MIRTNSGKKLLLTAAVLLLCLLTGIFGVRRIPDPLAEKEKEAACTMRRYMEAVKTAKEERGIPSPEEDIHGSGILGEEYTFITTTSGSLESKRTTADPNMAALLVRMLTEAGAGPGDVVTAGFSGSFPGMNLAVLAACDALDIRLSYIASVGASMWGANQPDMTFPDMLMLLWNKGLLKEFPTAFSMGGYRDVGADMDDELWAQILTRLQESGIPLIMTEDYEENISTRQRYYAEYARAYGKDAGEIRCFIGCGGNLTTIGRGEDQLPAGVIPGGYVSEVSEKSGLMEIYSAAGVPVIHILNIKQLAADYGLPFDPQEQPKIGEGILYETKERPVFCLYSGAVLALLILLAGRLEYGGKISKRSASLITGICCAACLLICGWAWFAQTGPGNRTAESAAGSGKETIDADGGPFAEASGASIETVEIGEGLTAVQIDSGIDGPYLYIAAGVHGDEIAGQRAASILLNRMPPAGKVRIVSPVNRYGAEHYLRKSESGRDINRNFPGSPDGNDAEKIAAAVFGDIAAVKPDFVLDLHEAHNHDVEGITGSSDELIDSLICEDMEGCGDLLWEFMMDEGEKIPDCPSLNIFSSPPAGSINRTVTRDLGIPVITVETDRSLPLTKRVSAQLEIVRFAQEYLIREYGGR